MISVTVTEGITREHLVTRQDVHNIKLQYNIEGIVRHHNDLTSVTAWVEEMQTLQYNPVLVFKPQGVTQTREMDNIGENDFLLVIQTEFQRDVLQKWGNDTICTDTTYNTNAYDFNLITLLVLDDFGEGIPVAWEIANREDVCMIVEILKVIRERTGPLTTVVYV